MFVVEKYSYQNSAYMIQFHCPLRSIIAVDWGSSQRSSQ